MEFKKLKKLPNDLDFILTQFEKAAVTLKYRQPTLQSIVLYGGQCVSTRLVHNIHD